MNLGLDKWGLCFVVYMFLSNYPSSGDINSSNLSCFYQNYKPRYTVIPITTVRGSLIIFVMQKRSSTLNKDKKNNKYNSFLLLFLTVFACIH